VISAEIKEKSKAKEMYEDAMAKGHTSTMAHIEEDKKSTKFLHLNIGNLMPE
jgi:hypothetical protein